MEREYKSEEIDQSHFYKDDDDENVITFSKIIGILLSNYKIIMLLGILGFVISIPYSLSLDHRYRAQTSLLIEKAGSSPMSALQTSFGGLGGFGVMAGLPNLPRAQETETLAIFKSRTFTEKIISELGVLPFLFEEAWDKDKNDWKVGQKPTEQEQYETMVGISTLDYYAKQGLHVYTIEMGDPVLVAKWANEAIALFNNYMREEAIVEAEKNRKFLEDKLKQTSLVKLQGILYNLIAAETQQSMLASVQEDFAFKIIDPAVVPDERVYPVRTQIVLYLTFASLFLGILIAFVKDLLGGFLRNVIISKK